MYVIYYCFSLKWLKHQVSFGILTPEIMQSIYIKYINHNNYLNDYGCGILSGNTLISYDFSG